MLKLAPDDIMQRAEDALRGLLAEVPFLGQVPFEAERMRPPGGLDFNIRMPGSTGEWRLLVQVKSSGEPRLARIAAADLLRYCAPYDDRAYGVFIAPYVSPAAAQICKSRGIGYIDLSGNCRFCFGNIFIELDGRPNKFAEKRDLRTLYSPKASRVLRVLLAAPRKPWTVVKLAKKAEVSLGLVSYVSRLLVDREWVVRQRGGISLTQPETLLSEWSANYSFQRSQAFDYYSILSVSKAEAELAHVCLKRQVRFALTAFSSAARMAPMVRYQRVFAYVDGELQEVAKELRLKEVSSGPNVTLLQPYDAGVFLDAQPLDDVYAVSAIQTYLDLASLKGRGEEAAQAVLEGVIRPQW
jgi:hypothetical protein